jgi:ketosteroid isomerase-like protein
MRMKASLVLLAVLGLTGPFQLRAQEGTGPEREVMQAHRARYAALVAQDVAALTPLLADEFEYCNSGGQVQKKQAYLDAIRAGLPRWLDIKEPVVNAAVYGNTAIVVSQNVPKVQSGNGPPNESPHRTLEVWVKRDGRWQIMQYQATIVRGAP